MCPTVFTLQFVFRVHLGRNTTAILVFINLLIFFLSLHFFPPLPHILFSLVLKRRCLLLNHSSVLFPLRPPSQTQVALIASLLLLNNESADREAAAHYQ